MAQKRKIRCGGCDRPLIGRKAFKVTPVEFEEKSTHVVTKKDGDEFYLCRNCLKIQR